MKAVPDGFVPIAPNFLAFADTPPKGWSGHHLR